MNMRAAVIFKMILHVKACIALVLLLLNSSETKETETHLQVLNGVRAQYLLVRGGPRRQLLAPGQQTQLLAPTIEFHWFRSGGDMNKNTLELKGFISVTVTSVCNIIVMKSLS